jgi:hypothetical protein
MMYVVRKGDNSTRRNMLTGFEYKKDSLIYGSAIEIPLGTIVVLTDRPSQYSQDYRVFFMNDRLIELHRLSLKGGILERL